MNILMFGAGLLIFMIGIIHSVLGEKRIFQRMRKDSLIPTIGYPLLRESHVRILWATWHLVTILGFGIGIILIRFAFPFEQQYTYELVEHTILGAVFGSSLLVLIATKGRHPGWIGLLLVAILGWLA